MIMTPSDEFSIQQGLLSTAEYIPSPNVNERPDNDISLLVIHNISLPPGEFGSNDITQLFLNQLDPSKHPYFEHIHTLKVSSHILIRRTGQVIQYVPFHKRAWHAGQSIFAGQTQCNDFAIGIELEGTDDLPDEPVQYHTLAKITSAIQREYPKIKESRITGHEHIAPGRKTDPGKAFDWALYFSLI